MSTGVGTDSSASSTTAQPGAESKMFDSWPGEERVRGARDATLIGIGIILVIVGVLLAGRTLRIETEILNVVDALPSWAHEGFIWSYGLGALFVLWVIFAAVLRRHPRWDIARDLVLAGVVAAGIALLLAQLIDGAWPVLLPELESTVPVVGFPIMRVSVVTAIVVAAGPHLVRPLRRLGWAWVVLVAISGLGVGLGVPTGAIGALGIGFVAGGAVLLLLGSSAGYPQGWRLQSDLGALGVRVGVLAPAPIQSWGARSLLGRDVNGRPVLVKVYGRDARNAQFFARAWRTLWYKETGPLFAFSRLQQVEHEALITVLSRDAGVAVPIVLLAATTKEDDAVLVTEDRGSPLTEFDADAISDEALLAIWQEVARLHAVSIAHGSLNRQHVYVDGADVILTGFDAGSLTATPAAIGTDVAELLVSLAVLVGAERSVAAASQGLGNESLAGVVSYLQLPAISRTTRKEADKAKKLVKSIQDEVVAFTGVEEPESVELRRVSVGSLVTTGLLIFAVYFMFQQLAGVDWASTWESIKSATWVWVLAGFIVGQTLLIPGATSFMAAVSVPLPLRPTMVLQSAIQFVNLAVPSAAGRVATNAAYLTKFGVGPVTAVTQGALDSVSLFLVQAAILVIAFLFGSLDFGVSTDLNFDVGLVLLIVVGVIVVGWAVLWLMKSLRERVLSVFLQTWGALRILIKEPKRAIVLFGSNFGTNLILGTTLWLMVRAYGTGVSLASALAIVVFAMLLGGMAPVPGGVGVQEAVLTAGLVSAGLPSDTAFAAAIMYRVVTFLLPPIWGYFSLHWLQKRGYV
jgi:uncharacterized membrane protein YbhN (UPF0104 family)/tRNA A-37 threonylcarbamoyl transferase component Bud32